MKDVIHLTYYSWWTDTQSQKGPQQTWILHAGRYELHERLPLWQKVITWQWAMFFCKSDPLVMHYSVADKFVCSITITHHRWSWCRIWKEDLCVFMLKTTNVSPMLKIKSCSSPILLHSYGINKQLQMWVSALMYVSCMCNGTWVNAGVGVVTTCCL